MMRSSHPATTYKAAELHDKASKDILCSVLPGTSNGVLTEEMLAQARLPLRMGGMGFAQSAGSGENAFVAAFSDALRSLTHEGDDISTPIAENMNRLFSATPRISECGVSQPPLPRGSQASSRAPPARAVSNASEASVESVSELTARRQPVLNLSEAPPESIESMLHSSSLWAKDKIRKLQHLPSVLEKDDQKDIPVSFLELSLTPRKLQRRTSNLKHKLEAASLRANVPAHTAARLLAVTQEGATDFLKAVPSDPSLTMGNEELSYSVAKLLGCPNTTNFYAAMAFDCPSCGENDNIQHAKFTHVDNCKVGGAHIYRHDKLVYAMQEMHLRAGHTYTREPRSQLLNSTQGGPDGIGVANDRPFLEEISYINPLNTPIPASKYPLYAAKKREEYKTSKFKSLAVTNNMDINVVVYETTGGQGAQFKKNLHAISKDWHAHNPSSSVPTMANDNSATWAASTFEIYWRQVFSVCLVKSSYYAASVVKATATKTRAQRHSAATGPGLVGIPATQPIPNITPFVTRCETASPVVGRSSPSVAATQD